jgi:NTP pyrophosphatase (non-canonical NTP hydrolase)
MSDPIGEKPRHWVVDHQAVQDFGNDMYKKLRDNADKAHWNTVSIDWLLNRMCDELEELRDACSDGSSADIISECADVANFAMMIADNVRLTPERS